MNIREWIDAGKPINKIIQGDCLEGLRQLGDNSVDLILTDIPYGEVNRDSNGLRNLDKGDADIFDLDLSEIILNFVRVTKGSIYVFCGTEQVSHIRKQLVSLGLSTRLCIWEKTNPSVLNGEYLWLSGIECCVYGRKKGSTFNENCKNSVWRYSVETNMQHPTQKSLRLFRYLVKVSSNCGDLILDCFMGSGTTAVACKQLNRNFIGFELSKEYCDIANKRLEQENLLDILKSEQTRLE